MHVPNSAVLIWESQIRIEFAEEFTICNFTAFNYVQIISEYTVFGIFAIEGHRNFRGEASRKIIHCSIDA